jgi:phosphoglycerate kinase
MKYIDEVQLTHKTILLRVDFNVSLNPNHSISDDARIRMSLPTIQYLLKHHNKIILIAHLGEPEKRNAADSLTRVTQRLKHYLPHHPIHFVEDFTKETSVFKEQKENELILLENIRFYPGEVKNDPAFAKELAKLGDVYVNDAFSVCHRKQVSIVGLPALLPSYAGLLLKKEITSLEMIMKHPQKPFIALMGGKKISTKIQFLNKLVTMADHLLLGGGLANTFLLAQGFEMGGSIVAKEELSLAKKLITLAKKEHTEILLPKDAVVGSELASKQTNVKKITDIQKHDLVLDIGPETQADFGAVIDRARTIVWNGPLGYIENPQFKRGTDFLYYSITQNSHAISVVGGGDTLAAINNKEYLDKLTHISMGGGAMLEFIENGTLPGIEALKKAKTR